MKTKVLIAHAKGEEELAEQLAVPIRAAGYEVAHEGTVLVGESVVAEAVVDAALLAILHPLDGESGTVRPRAVLAALCLADEPTARNPTALRRTG